MKWCQRTSRTACGHRQAMVGHGHGGAEWMELNYSLEPGPSGCSLFKVPWLWGNAYELWDIHQHVWLFPSSFV